MYNSLLKNQTELFNPVLISLVYSGGVKSFLIVSWDPPPVLWILRLVVPGSTK